MFNFLKVLLSVLVAGGVFQLTVAQATCGFNHPGGTIDNPIITEPISDDEGPNIRFSETPWFGELNSTSAESNAHYSYLTAALDRSKSVYYIRTNDKTEAFTRTLKTRTMLRAVTLRCNDGTVSSKYYFQIPVQDMSPPKFLETPYEFSVRPGHPYFTKPISDGHFVIVGDNAYEFHTGERELEFLTTIPDSLRIEAVKLWRDDIDPLPAMFYYRLDIYLHDDYIPKVVPGSTVEMGLSVLDGFNTGAAIIRINFLAE